MIRNTPKIAPDGHEVFLFPCEVMYLTTARIPPEHDVLALDFLPRNAEGDRITMMPVYAPFSGRIVFTGNDHNCILESDDVVWTSLGLKKMRVLVAHQEAPPPAVGTHFNQGDLYYRTGNYGQSSGEHLHMEIAEAISSSYWNTGGIGLRNAVHMWEGLYVDDTVLLRTGDLPWVEYGDTPMPEIKSKKHKFKWVLYARKLRNK